MPIYEYRCSKCGDFEAMQKISDEPLTNCPTCRRKVTKLISNTSFQLKGSGWYITDYARKGGGGKSESADAGENASGLAKTESTATDASASGTKDDGGGKPAKSKKKSTSATKAA